MSKNNILKNFIKYVSLNVLGMIGLSCYILADTFFISKAFGSDGLASLNFAISIYCIINGMGLMIGIGGATRFAVYKSQESHQKANVVFTHTVLLGLAVGLILFSIGMFLSTPLAKCLGADDNTLLMTSSYLKTILCFSPCFILNNILIFFIRNDGNPKLSMSAMLLSSFSNIVLDYVFIFELSMGMFGAAFATSLSAIISIGLLFTYFIKHKNNFKFTSCKLEARRIIDIFLLGLSAFITEVSSGIVLIVFNLVILKIEGNIGVAAYGIIANISLIIIAIFTGIAQGIQPLASEGYGKNDTQLLNKILRYGVMLSMGIAVIIYTLIFMGSDNIIKIFNSENNVQLIPIAKNGFKIYSIGFLFAGINIVSAAFLSATANPKYAFFISIMRGCIAIIPLVFVLSLIFSMNGVWISFTFSEIITTFLSIIYIGKFKKIK